MTKLIRAAIVGACCGPILLTAACGNQEAARQSTETIVGEPTRVVAQVDTFRITLGEVSQICRAWKQGRFPDIDPSSPEGVLQRRAIENRIDQVLLFQAAQERGLVPPEAEIDAQIQSIRARFPSREMYDQTLAQQGTTEREIADAYRTDRAVRRFVESTILDTVKVEPEEARRYYDTHLDEFVRPELVRARHILVAVPAGAPPEQDAAAKEKLLGLARRISAGEDFGSLAMAASDDMESAARGGDLGYFPRGQTVPPFEAAAFSLQPGQLSELVRTDFGYHLIRVDERKPAGPAPYEEIALQLLEKLRRDRADDRVKAFLEERRKKTKIRWQI